MITYNRILAAGLLMGSSVVAMADGKFSLSKIDLAPGETRTVTVYLENEEAISQFQVDIVLPEGLEFVQNSFFKTDNLIEDIAAARQMTDQSGRTWRIGTMNFGGNPILNTDNNVAEEKTAIFTFDVKANDEWRKHNPNEVANDTIKITNAALSTPEGIEEPVLDVNDNVAPNGNGTIATSVAGKMVIKADDIKLTLNGDVLTEDAIELLPTKESKKISVNLWSHGETARTWMENPGDSVSRIALVSGTITLPKGVFYKDNTGKVNTERTKTASGSNVGIQAFNQVINADGLAEVTFTVGRYAGGLRHLDGELFSFEVYGADPYDTDSVADTDGLAGFNIQTGKIVIDNIKMSVSDGTAGTQVFPNEVLTVNVTNQNQIIMDALQPEIDALKKSLADNIAAIPAPYNEDGADTKAQIDKATEAVNDFIKAVDDAYAVGEMEQFADGGLLQTAKDEVAAILTAFRDEYNEDQQAIYNKWKDIKLRPLEGEELYYKEYPGIKAVNDPETGKFAVAMKKLNDDKTNFETLGEGYIRYNNSLAADTAALAQIIKDYEDSIAVAKGLYETMGHIYALTQSTMLPEMTDEQGKLVKYPAVAAILGDEGTFAKAKEKATEKWEAAKTAGTAYDVDFKENSAELGAIAEAFVKALAEADSAQDAHQAIYEAWVDTTLTAVGDSVRAYQAIVDKQAEFAAAIAALTAKYEAVSPETGDSTLVNYDFAADTAAIKTIMEEFAGIVAEADANAAENTALYKKALEDYAAEEIEWYDQKDRIYESNGIKAADELFQGRIAALKDAYGKVKNWGQLADKPCRFQDNITSANPTKGLKAAFEALQKAIDESVEEFATLDSLETEVMPGLDTKLTEEEIAKAKVVNPAEVTGSNQVSTLSQEAYNQLIEELGELNNQLDDDIESWEQQFQAGELTKAELDELLATVDDAIAAIEKEAMKKIVAHLITYQRGDVGGDGRWTTNDYARVRRMILDAAEPEISSWKKTGTGQYTKIEIDADNSQDAYDFARYDVNRDGQINVGDAQAALNFTFYGDEFNHDATYEAARNMTSTEENVTATANGNVIAIALQNGRQYSAFQMDVVLPEGMTISSETLGLRNEGFTLSSNDVNGVHRILVTSAQGKAFEGNEGDVLYLELSGNGSVEFQNVIFADVNSATTTFQLEAAVVGETTGISAAKTENGVMGTIYDLGGRMMKGLKKGINIIRNANGDTQKVIK